MTAENSNIRVGKLQNWNIFTGKLNKFNLIHLNATSKGFCLNQRTIIVSTKTISTIIYICHLTLVQIWDEN